MFAAADIVHLHAFVLIVENIVLWNVGSIPYREVDIEWLLRSVSREGCKVIEGSDDRLGIKLSSITRFVHLEVG